MGYYKFKSSVLTVFILLFYGCNYTKNSKEDSKTENSFIDTQVEWSKYQVSKSILEQLSVAICEKEKLELNEYTLIYYFRGDCSACIASFINWYKEFNGYFLNSKVSYMFVNFGKELDLLLYYIDEADLQFRHCLYEVLPNRWTENALL